MPAVGRLGHHISYDDPSTLRAALLYSRGQYQESLLRGWSPWDGTLPAWPGRVGIDRPDSINNLLDRLTAHGFRWERCGSRGMRIARDREMLLTRLRSGRMTGPVEVMVPAA